MHSMLSVKWLTMENVFDCAKVRSFPIFPLCMFCRPVFELFQLQRLSPSDFLPLNQNSHLRFKSVQFCFLFKYHNIQQLHRISVAAGVHSTCTCTKLFQLLSNQISLVYNELGRSKYKIFVIEFNFFSSLFNISIIII